LEKAEDLPIIPEGSHNIERIRRAARIQCRLVAAYWKGRLGLDESPIQALTGNLETARIGET
jgi:hypothetical protein